MRSNSKSIKQRIDSIHISESDRELAKAYMESAEHFAETVFRITDGFKALFAAGGHHGKPVAHHH
ncbi:MAG TPA: hypothetical protein VLT92_04340 [Burkholderiales bacterium]|nr:hypothetical protein [Burkholderiales bacterium]